VAAGAEKLRLGKGVFFVKTQLRRLKQEDDTWEADFFPIPCPESEPSEVWIGLVLSHTDDYLLAQRTERRQRLPHDRLVANNASLSIRFTTRRVVSIVIQRPASASWGMMPWR
jgi:hypothetical protein